MRRRLLYAGLIMTLIFIVVGSNSNNHAYEGKELKQNQALDQSQIDKLSSILILYFSKMEGISYTPEIKVEDSIAANEIINILHQSSWDDAKVLMSRQPDYKLRAINSDPYSSSYSLTYSIWLSPKKDLLEVVIDHQSKYSKLTI
ncbi:hypothetical protein [Paenibacillus sp. L3-i20]|uniref:hypothetical protein n=1 Tax=Paenibacillus sp. L3-i20 TaxID=2905833 RepID=UPI001EE00C1B|nr:hypothetical protein [Paenibacillus sp. L3-i20]GKU77990.1 hypothetical protein L3i20_v223870 [Paenibacillus sp. L3-i20]